VDPGVQASKDRGSTYLILDFKSHISRNANNTCVNIILCVTLPKALSWG